MNQNDIDAVMRGMASSVRSFVEQAVMPLARRIAAIEDNLPRDGRDGKDGTSVTVDDIRPLISEEVEKLPPAEPGKSVTADDVRPLLEEMVAALPKPENGKDADPELIELMVSEAVAKLPPAEPGKSVDPEEVAELVSTQVEKAVAALPKPENGKDVDLADVRLIVAEEVAKIPPPTNGKDADPEQVVKLVTTEVQKAVAALPPAEAGKSVTVEDVRPLIAEEVAKIPPAKDGVGLAGALIDRAGELVVTLTDGSQRTLGPVVGKDGAPGEPGLGFEDMTETLDEDGRTIIRTYSRGEQNLEFRHAFGVLLDAGPWKPGPFVKGDVVSYGGQMYIARRDTTAEPMTPEAKDDWRLSVKKGRDGKDLRAEQTREPAMVKFK